MIDSRGHEVIVDRVVDCDGQERHVRIGESRGRAGSRPKIQIRRDRGINGDLALIWIDWRTTRWEISPLKRQKATACGCGRDFINGSITLPLPERFVVDEEEGFALDDWTADRAPVLIAVKRRRRTRVKKTSRIQCRGTKKPICIAVKLAGSRARNGVNNSAGRSPVFRRIVAGNHGKFRDRVNANGKAGHTSGPASRVIHDAHSIDAVVIILRTRAGNRNLISEAAIAASRAGPGGLLS